MKPERVFGTVIGVNSTAFNPSYHWAGKIMSAPSVHKHSGKTCIYVQNELVNAMRQLNLNTFTGSILWEKGCDLSWNAAKKSFDVVVTGNGSHMAEMTYENGELVNSKIIA